MKEHIFAKKSLGQNFLKCGYVLGSIIGASDINPKDTVLEIGPGKGILTSRLLEKGVRVYAVEKDDRLVPYLQNKFQEYITDKKLILIHGDILDKQIQQKIFSELKNYKIIANIPYYITGQLLEDFLSSENQPEKMVLLLQKEVVKRIVATDKKESILSISVKAYGSVKKVADVPRTCFSPVPNVDSAILQISDISKGFLTHISEKDFFKVVKTGFAQKRKMLMNNLSQLFDKEKVKAVFEIKNMDPRIRAENVDPEAWKEITEELSKDLIKA